MDRADGCLRRAFLAGKMSVDDVPLIKALIAAGTCLGPRHLPVWFKDEDTLCATFTHAVTMQRSFADSQARSYAQRAEHGDALGLKVPTAPDDPAR